MILSNLWNCGRTLPIMFNWLFTFMKVNRGFSCDVISSQFCKSRVILSFAVLVSSLCGSVLENTTKCPVILCLLHTIIPHYNWVKWILEQTLGWKFKFFHEVDQAFQRLFLFFFLSFFCFVVFCFVFFFCFIFVLFFCLFICLFVFVLFLVLFFLRATQKGNQWISDKIMSVKVCIASCKPFIIHITKEIWQ